ncbi:peptidoglycan bridge formation glycyltransferase FemA/FemB family protein [Candidatus Gottesmanbacteria bacterium]|nr:peptidoglycan bridge formation glycyltransferase FemA/FemB family protein [Candidatus Gottesmanbacteria bacterium]
MNSTVSEIPTYSSHFDKLAPHPLQSWEWGEFRKKTGIQVYRFGEYEDGKLKAVYQMTLHKIPKLNYFIGYIPKSVIPSKQFLIFLKDFLKNKNVIFVKFEPNIESSHSSRMVDTLLPSLRPLFTKYTFQIDLTKSEQELLAQMKDKAFMRTMKTITAFFGKHYIQLKLPIFSQQLTIMKYSFPGWYFFLIIFSIILMADHPIIIEI